MLHHTHTYEAYLEGNTLRWIGKEPPSEEKKKSVRVKIEIPNEQQSSGNAAKAVEYLEKIAKTGIITEDWVKDWEESRKDRKLPGR